MGNGLLIDISPEIECIIKRERLQSDHLLPPSSRDQKWIR